MKATLGRGQVTCTQPCSSLQLHRCRPHRRACTQHIRPQSYQVKPVAVAVQAPVNSSAESATEQRTQTGHSASTSARGQALLGHLCYTRFFWPKHLQGEDIQVWGSFNNWKKGIKLLRFSRDQDASVVLALKPGNYQFKYVVDGAWQEAPHEAVVTNSEGHLNNFRVVAPTIRFKLLAPDAKQVLVVGDWDSFQYALLLEKDPATGTFHAQAQLKPGQQRYHYVVDGRVTVNPEEPTVEDPVKGRLHEAWSCEPLNFKVFYCTGWERTVLHYRRIRNGQPVSKEFKQVNLVGASSRSNSLGSWKLASLVPGAADEQLEFYLTNGQTDDKLKTDRPVAGGLYRAPHPGSYKLVRGQVRPFPRGNEQRYMLVSDIDGTMIGDTSDPEAFSSSARFQAYWESNAALSGSLLVYNTGRSLGQFVDLMKKCENKIAVPDVVVTAVGTKVWLLDEDCGRCQATGTKWVEDQHYTLSLDEGWDLNIVRRLAQQVVSHYNDEAMAKILDDGSEHRHRTALCCDMQALDHITKTLAQGFLKERLEVRIIVSGAGSHRYVDCVPVHAGKEKALQYIRRHYNIPEHLCVAAGDSGNDVLMLEGDHPGIVVGNAQPELVHWLVSQPASQEGKVVLTEAFHADGILEGLARHSLY